VRNDHPARRFPKKQSSRDHAENETLPWRGVGRKLLRASCAARRRRAAAAAAAMRELPPHFAASAIAAARARPSANLLGSHVFSPEGAMAARSCGAARQSWEIQIEVSHAEPRRATPRPLAVQCKPAAYKPRHPSPMVPFPFPALCA
jgi:hypothetical protein